MRNFMLLPMTLVISFGMLCVVTFTTVASQSTGSCSSSPCHSNATCTNTNSSFMCTCNDGFTGDGFRCVEFSPSAYLGCYVDKKVRAFDHHMEDKEDMTISKCLEYCLQTNYEYAGLEYFFECYCGDDKYSQYGAANEGECNAKCSGDETQICGGTWRSSVYSVPPEIDECYLNVDNCHELANCTNTVGSYTCTCIENTSGDGFNCVDDDECTSSTHNCDENAICINTPGSFTCSCLSGFTGDGVTCTDIDECSSSNCHKDAICTNTDGSYICHCNDGFFGDGFNCTGPDLCKDSGHNPCDENAACTFVNGRYKCRCNNGYSGNGEVCEDIDECLPVFLNGCDENASCENVPGSRLCTCGTGYTGDGVNCTKFDECAFRSTNPCHENAICITNEDGPAICKCNAGFTGTGRECSDIDECCTSFVKLCDDSADCVNTIGSYMCSCDAGYGGEAAYRLNQDTCSDIDECSSSSSNNCDENASCTNTDGSYSCTCNKGFTGDGKQCVELNECTTSNPCHALASCSVVDGVTICTCTSGYEGDGMTSCTELNECASSSFNECDKNANCLNTVGSYTCSCKQPGFIGDGFSCEDINECFIPGESDCHDDASCQNTPGSYTCSCKAGYTGDGVTSCTVIGWETVGVQKILPNRKSSPITFLMILPLHTKSQDIDECSLASCHADANCTNTIGSFTCVCNEGLSGDGLNCFDFLDSIYLGCYKDTKTRSLPNQVKVDGLMTIPKCMQKCIDGGYKYCGLQYSRECYCGSGDYALHGKAPESDCNKACDGDKEKMCGGLWRASVYPTSG